MDNILLNMDIDTHIPHKVVACVIGAHRGNPGSGVAMVETDREYVIWTIHLNRVTNRWDASMGQYVPLGHLDTAEDTYKARLFTQIDA